MGRGGCLLPRAVVAALGLVLAALLPGKAPGQKFGPYPDIEDEAFIKSYIDAHNKYRSEVSPAATNMRFMSFDIALARIAKAYGKKCIWKHNARRHVHPDPTFRPFGENMWMGTATKGLFNPAGPIKSFYQEVNYYDYDSNKCTRVCGHYTQVVWANSYKVGCAVVFCRFLGKQKHIAVVVCDYGPPGNYVGARPYKAGQSCSQCAKGDTCENKLCRNPERDKANTSYADWYPPYTYDIRCDAACIAVAVLRPLLMFVVFAVVYSLKLYYPGLGFKI